MTDRKGQQGSQPSTRHRDDVPGLPTLPRPTTLAATVRAALGLRRRAVLDAETETRISVWDIRHLNDVFTRVGGTAAAREVQRILSDGTTTYTVTEVTITAELPGIGAVEAFTDWDPADESHAFTLPVIVALAQVSPTANARTCDECGTTYSGESCPSCRTPSAASYVRATAGSAA